MKATGGEGAKTSGAEFRNPPAMKKIQDRQITIRQGASPVNCESCGMPIESGHYCQYCTDDHGNLQEFDERFEKMVAWQARRTPQADRAELEAATLDYLATMPAWRDHPRVSSRR